MSEPTDTTPSTSDDINETRHRISDEELRKVLGVTDEMVDGLSGQPMDIDKHVGKNAGEVVLDSRKRLPMASLDLKYNQVNQRFRITEHANGEILLTPMFSMTVEELGLIKNPEALVSLLEGIAEADAGKTSEWDGDEEDV